MAIENNARARMTFDTLCSYLDKDEWHYDKDETKLTIDTGARGDDLPMRIRINVSEEKQHIFLMSVLPADVPSDKRVELAVAIAAANYDLLNGAFDYDIQRGSIIFKMVTSFIESDVSEELFRYMTLVSFHTIDKYNDKFLMLAKGMVTLDKFLESIKND